MIYAFALNYFQDFISDMDPLCLNALQEISTMKAERKTLLRQQDELVDELDELELERNSLKEEVQRMLANGATVSDNTPHNTSDYTLRTGGHKGAKPADSHRVRPTQNASSTDVSERDKASEDTTPGAHTIEKQEAGSWFSVGGLMNF